MDDRPLFLSYPKSGRTWVRYMLDLAGIAVDFSHAGTGSRRHALGRPFHGIDQARYAGRRTIFMHRNPIDTTVSFYFQVHRRELIRGSWKSIRRYPFYALTGRWPPAGLEAFIEHPGYGLEKVCRFNRAWLDHLAGRSDAQIMTYEAMTSNGEHAVSELLKFLGADPNRAAALLEQSRFDAMRRVEIDSPQGRALSPGIAGDPESLKVRRGKVQGYLDYLDAETVARCRTIASRYGFDA